jgi:hypothetical protein
LDPDRHQEEWDDDIKEIDKLEGAIIASKVEPRLIDRYFSRRAMLAEEELTRFREFEVWLYDDPSNQVQGAFGRELRIFLEVDCLRLSHYPPTSRFGLIEKFQVRCPFPAVIH